MRKEAASGGRPYVLALGAGARSSKLKGSGTGGNRGVSFDMDGNFHSEPGRAMQRRSANAGDTNSWDRSLAVKLAGLAMLVSAALLLLGGAYREEADMIRSGLLFLAMGVVLVSGALHEILILKVAFCALAMIGVFFALATWFPLPWNWRRVEFLANASYRLPRRCC